MSLKDKVSKSFALKDEEGYKVYKGFAIDPDDEKMFQSEEEVDAYRNEAIEKP